MAERFETNGYAVLAGGLDAALVAELASAVDRIQASVSGLSPSMLARLTFERDLPAHRRDGIAPDATGNAIFIIGDPVAFDPVFWAVLQAPGVVRACAMALGPAALEAHFMNVTIKHARFGRAIGWHRDFPNGYASPSLPRFVRVMACLDGMAV